MPRLEDYSFGRLVIDGDEHRRDVIVLPGRVVADWWRRDGHSLQIEDLEPVLDELPPTLIVGCGAQGRLTPDPGADISEKIAGAWPAPAWAVQQAAVFPRPAPAAS